VEEASGVSYLLSFAAGTLLFFSPCLLPLIPSYISYLTGISFGEFQGEPTKERKKEIKRLTIIHSLFFILGFSFVFVSLGMTVTVIGRIFFEYQAILKKVGAALIILFGLSISGLLKIGILLKEKRIAYRKKGISYIGTFLMGSTFAFAWTPCVGPLLGSVLVYASSTASAALGFRLLSVFSLGLAVPFFISSLMVNSFLLYFKKIKDYIKWVNLIAGVILVLFGVLILMGRVF